MDPVHLALALQGQQGRAESNMIKKSQKIDNISYCIIENWLAVHAGEITLTLFRLSSEIKTSVQC